MDRSHSRLTTKNNDNRDSFKGCSINQSPSKNELLEEFLTVEKRTSNFNEVSSSPVFQTISSPNIVAPGLKKITDCNEEDSNSMNDHMKDVRGRNQKLIDVFYKKRKDGSDDLSDSLDENES